MRVGLISSYPPRQCGIGAFTHSLWTSLVGNHPDEPSPIVVAMNTPAQEELEYPTEVRFEIQRDNPRDYRQAAQFLNSSNVDVVCVQHEFGLFGGLAGAMLIDLLRRLERPIVSTMHTVLAEPPPDYRRVTERLTQLSSRTIVISRVSGRILREHYEAPADRVVQIPHGAPDRAFLDPSYFKAKYDMAGRRVMLTFGLLGPGKGLETALAALSQIVAKHPTALYVIAGATHPEEKKRNGERYRLSLQRQVEELGLTDNVHFVNRFLDLEELCEFLHAADLYVTPYPNREQISSGTLAYAVALGKAIVSTNYFYAEELLDEERGILVPPRDPQALADAFDLLLTNEVKRDEYRRKTYEHGRQMIWSAVAERYRTVFENSLAGYVRTTRNVPSVTNVRGAILPDMKLDYMRMLTDDIGIFHYAAHQAPEWEHGYCTDDNARALMVAVRNQHVARWDASRYIHRYLTFLANAQRQDGSLRNFLSHDRRWLERTGSMECNGRGMWAAGFCVRFLDHRPHEMLAKRIFDRAMSAVGSLQSLRAKAYAMQGMVHYLNVFAGAREVRAVLRHFVEDLTAAYRSTAGADWRWFENILSYANAQLCYSLLVSAQLLEDDAAQQIALEALDFLDSLSWRDGRLSLIGNEGWYPRGGARAQFDQLPIDAGAIVRAYHGAYMVAGRAVYLDKMRRAFEWYLGNNDLGLALVDLELGACADGLRRTGINSNYGAEATLSYLSSLTYMQEVKEFPALIDEPAVSRRAAHHSAPIEN
jgi:glycosyltransferase involved in cell wall biosynthesis